MEFKNILEGVHKKQHFRFNNGKLEMFGRTWDREDVQTLMDTVNLLQLQNYKLKIPTGVTQKEYYDPFSFGGMRTMDVKTYDDETGD